MLQLCAHSFHFHRFTCALGLFFQGVETKHRNKLDCEADLCYLLQSHELTLAFQKAVTSSLLTRFSCCCSIQWC